MHCPMPCARTFVYAEPLTNIADARWVSKVAGAASADTSNLWQEEAQRLAGILASFPTSEQQDQVLLDDGSMQDWRERVIVRFRMLRKQALRLTIEGIEAALAKGRPRPVVPVEGASDKLQKPLFIQIGAGGAAEL